MYFLFQRTSEGGGAYNGTSEVIVQNKWFGSTDVDPGELEYKVPVSEEKIGELLVDTEKTTEITRYKQVYWHEDLKKWKEEPYTKEFAVISEVLPFPPSNIVNLDAYAVGKDNFIAALKVKNLHSKYKKWLDSPNISNLYLAINASGKSIFLKSNFMQDFAKFAKLSEEDILKLCMFANHGV